MDIKEINDYGQELINRLNLKTSPVAVKLIPTGGQVPEGIKKAEEAMRHCQMIDLVRRTGQEFYATVDEQQCKGGAASMGIGQMPPKVASGEFYYSGIKQFGALEAAKLTVDMAPTLPENTNDAIVYAPLEKASFTPDVVVMICNPKQIMLLTQAIMYKEGGRLEVSFAGKQSICSDGVVQAYRDEKVGVTVGCSGSRAYTEIADEEMTIGIPVKLLKDVVAGVEKICPN